jgi:rhamnogalacturonan endolyase
MIRQALLFFVSAMVLCCVPLRANDAGGGTPGRGAPVKLTVNDDTATLDNGLIRAVINKSSGRISRYQLAGTDMVDPTGSLYYSFDGGSNYETPSDCVLTVVNQSADSIEISCKRTWKPDAGYKHAFDIDLHYILRRGDTGLYAFATLDHPATYPDTGFGEWRIVWKLPRDETIFAFERAYVDELRHWEMPSPLDFKQSSSTGIKEIVKLNSGVRAGLYDCKYTYSARYFDIGTWGHASNLNRKGVWFVLGGHDYFNDGPTHPDLTLAADYLLLHLFRNHYRSGPGVMIAAGETWRQQYGPFLLYCNQTSTTANAGDVLWADARTQVAAEKAAWPYKWLVNPDHPAASDRGTVTGKFQITDSLNPAVSSAGAHIGLAAAEEADGNWQFQSKGYQYWTVADAKGNFTLPAVRPGTYTLYAYNTGAVGEFSQKSVTVTAGKTASLGTVTWSVPHAGRTVAWEIGIPDRTAREFRHGDDYFQPYLWDIYPKEFSNPLIYTVGTSNPARDWNYVHSALPATDDSADLKTWDWQIHFNLRSVPSKGDATLVVAFASAHSPRLSLLVNDAPEPNRINPPVYGGNALMRQGIHGKYSFVNVAIPVSLLKPGANTFTLRFSGTSQAAHVMYDYLRLELP